MNILALEASTSSAKAVLYSGTGGIIAARDQAYDLNISNVVTQDPGGIYRALLDCGSSLIKSHGKDIKGDIDAIALCSTWHSLLFTDRRGEPVGRILTWANNNAADIVSRYRGDTGLVNDIYKRTGCPVHTNFPLWKWLHFKEDNDIDTSSLRLSSQAEYIFRRMTGDWGVSLSAASGSGFLNIHTLDWDEGILEFADLTIDQLAPLRDPEYTAPLRAEAAKALCVREGIPVVITGPDGAFNQVGAGAMGDGIMTMSVGTSGAIRMATDSPILPEVPSTWCYYVAEGKRLAGAATSGAGNCVNWFVKTLNKNKYSYNALENFIDETRLMDAPTFLPFMFGERSPGWEGSRLGGFTRLRGEHGLGELYYSVLEGILLNIYQCYEILTRVGGTPRDIRISGGIENSEFWLQMAADIFQREIQTFDLEHASTMGAIAMALKALGGMGSLQEFKLNPKKTIVPNKDKAEFYENRFQQYKEWYHKA
ncbi:MAG TPA: FGGY family carbohydrate kinase [Clostridia bacterium]|nr:FGGY family carbohydrate kinase [Clostridia bacterium]